MDDKELQEKFDTSKETLEMYRRQGFVGGPLGKLKQFAADLNLSEAEFNELLNSKMFKNIILEQFMPGEAVAAAYFTVKRWRFEGYEEQYGNDRMSPALVSKIWHIGMRYGLPR